MWNLKEDLTIESAEGVSKGAKEYVDILLPFPGINSRRLPQVCVTFSHVGKAREECG